MEPVSASIGIASSTVTLAALALSISKTLTTVVNTHRQSAALIYSLIGACKAIELAWQRIHVWIEAHSFAESGQDSSFLEQLVESIDVAHAVLSTLQQDLEPYTLNPGQKSASGTWRALLNETTLRDHCVRLNLQVSSTHLLLATANLLVPPKKAFTLAGVLMSSRPQPKTRNLVCDCLRPVFRKDEESAWTIVATRAPSSRDSLSSLSKTKEDNSDSTWSFGSFAFINDLLTAPVYKRVVLSALQPPKASQKFYGVPPSAYKDQTLPRKSPAASIHESCITITNRQSLAPTATNCINTTDGDSVLLAANAASASGVFSSSVVADLNGAKPFRWLPLRARVNRGQLTFEEESRIDAELLGAAKRNSLIRMAKALDAGADINSVEAAGSHQTALQIATNTLGCCSAVDFLLHYRDVNLYVRDERGGTLLHTAARLECETCIQSLLDVGLSMTDKDENGISAFNWSAEKCLTTRPLVTLLRHATKGGIGSSDVTALDPHALDKLCCQTPIIRGDHARVLARFGWSLMTHVNPRSTIFCHILKKEHWLLKEMIEHPKAIMQIRAKTSAWDKVLLAATTGPGKNAEIVLQLLQAGIVFRHLTSGIYRLAVKKKDRSLLEFLVRHTNPSVSLENLMGCGGDQAVVAVNAKPQPTLQELDALQTKIANDSDKRQNPDVRPRPQNCGVMEFEIVYGPEPCTDVVIKVTPENRSIVKLHRHLGWDLNLAADRP
jgi:Ankyrin repeats (3 copies)